MRSTLAGTVAQVFSWHKSNECILEQFYAIPFASLHTCSFRVTPIAGSSSLLPFATTTTDCVPFFCWSVNRQRVDDRIVYTLVHAKILLNDTLHADLRQQQRQKVVLQHKCSTSQRNHLRRGEEEGHLRVYNFKCVAPGKKFTLRNHGCHGNCAMN